MILGVDLSSTATGVCLDGEASVITPPKGAPLLERAQYVVRNLPYRSDGAHVAVIEAIGTRQVNTAIALAYMHALTAVHMEIMQTPVVTVPPAALKKFATGKGNADKVRMAMAAQRCGYSGPENDNAIDAWWLWAIGKYATDFCDVADVPVVAYRHDVVTSLDWPVEVEVNAL